MMTVRWVVSVLFLLLCVWGSNTPEAHKGHTHVMGTVTAVHTSQLVVQTKDGRTVAIQVDRNTRYRFTGVATSGATVRVGDRVVVEVTEEANGLRAAEVRYAAAPPRTP